MMSLIRKANFIFLVFILSLPIMINSCGGGGGGGGSVTAGSPATGSVAVLLTDAPSGEFSEIWLTITSIQLISDERNVTIFSGEKTIDLLELEDETALFCHTSYVPAITYNKIRLKISKVVLVPTDPTRENIYPKLTGNGKLDLNPRRSFRVDPDHTLVLRIDMDGTKSVHIHLTGNGIYMFRPVVFIDILKGIFDTDKLVRLKGFVRNLDKATETFALCPTSETPYWPTSALYDEGRDDDLKHLNNRCVTVDASEGTSIFNSDGNPADFSALDEDDFVTVTGYFRTIKSNGGEDDNNDVLYMNDDEMLILDAEVIEIGDFQQLSGTIISSPDIGGEFDFVLDPGQGVVVDNDIVTVQLQNGTKIFSDTGDPLDESSLNGVSPENPLPATIDGVLIISDLEPDLLKSSLIILDADGSAVTEKLEGTISNINYPEHTFDLILSPTETICVQASEKTHIFLVLELAQTLESEYIGFNELMNGQSAEVYGHFDSSYTDCFITSDILAQ
jgi:hypothetical protein